MDKIFTSSSDDHAKFNGPVTVVRPLTYDEADIDDVGPMFECRSQCGTLFHCFDDELSDEWSGSPDPDDPDNFWIDDATGERVNAHTGERSS